MNTTRKNNKGEVKRFILAEGPHHFTTAVSRLGWFHYYVNLDVGTKIGSGIISTKNIIVNDL